MQTKATGPVIHPLTTMPPSSHGVEAFHACDSGVKFWEYHSHDFYEFYLHIRGADFFCLDNDRYPLKPNVLVLVPPFSMHGLDNDGVVNDYERGYLNLSSEKLKELGCGQLDLDAFFRTYTSRGNFMVQLSESEAGEAVRLLDRVQEQSPASSPAERYRICAMIISFLSEICDIMSRSAPIAAAVTPNTLMQDVLTYINNNYTQPISMNDLARRFGISVSGLAHEFSRYTRRSVYDYVLYRRIMLAREMISTPMSLSTIAYQCGFNDYSNFLRSFHKMVGMSPKEYRQTRK